MNHYIIDGTTRDGAESSNRLHYATARKLPRLSSEDRPDDHTLDGSAAGYRRTDNALQTVHSLPKRSATKVMIRGQMTTKVHLQTITHGSSTGVLR